MNEDLKVFSAGANNALTEEICDRIGIPLSRLDISRFSNDNLSVQVKESVREKDVFVVQSLTQPASDNIMALMLTLDALRSASCGEDHCSDSVLFLCEVRQERCTTDIPCPDP